MILGIDFDNTIINYDQVLYRLAVERSLIEPMKLQCKKSIRDQVRLLPDGEVEWQKLQAAIYGPLINEAAVAKGFKSFFDVCRLHSIRIFIISHKTIYASCDDTGTNLRLAALDWMINKGFLEENDLELDSKNFYFTNTRAEKVSLINKLGCTHFIDDLEETFLESGWSTEVTTILYAPDCEVSSNVSVDKVAKTWQEITDYLFTGQ